MRSIPHTPRGTNLVSMHTKMPRVVDRIFVGQPLDPRGKGLGPPRPPGLVRTFKIFWITNGESKANHHYH
jgi:hypothetical protein